MDKAVFCTADILLPKNVDMTKWSVVACDQYTSEPDYWHRVEEQVGEAPSTLHITLPEVYLEGEDLPGRIQTINQTMEKYLQEDLLQVLCDSFLYVERTLADKQVRKGLVGAVDLEQYDYARGSQSLIRATEGTVLERIPPRVRVRENAALELPHIMLLVDDQARTVIEPLGAQTGELKQVYDFALMENGGSIRGWQVPKDRAGGVQEALKTLADQEVFEEKYQVAGKGALLFAVGDGNHSLATAKACYENLKAVLSPEQAAVHPARYALVELVNIHDPALEFEPIHRVVFGADPDNMMKRLAEYFLLSETPCNGQKITVLRQGREQELWIKNPCSNLAVGSLQAFLDEYLRDNGGKVDYIHGEQVVRELSEQPSNVGFLLPNMEKSQLFPTVILDGALPRKTFSMGHAWDKRYYLESRRIR